MKLNLSILALIAFCYLSLACKKHTTSTPPHEKETGAILSAGVTLTADGKTDTYALINKVFGGTGDVVEVPDCGHPDFGKHIRQVFDKDLNAYVFVFFLHVSPDNDRCTPKTDRQRIEIKTYDKSPDSLIGALNNTFVYKWKMRLDKDFQASPSFSHLHQIKPGDGDADMPIITLTARNKKAGNKLEVIHNGGGDDQTSLGKLHEVSLKDFQGQWVEFTETVRFSEHGSYEIKAIRVADQQELLHFKKEDLNLWRKGTTFCRPKWGLYRSLNDKDYLRDEEIRFNDFSIQRTGK